MNTGLTSTLGKAPPHSELAEIWRELESRARPSFFQTWIWIGTWLEQIVGEPWLITVRDKDRVVGLGLVVKHLDESLGLKIPTLYLTQTGIKSEDAIFTEFNGFLVAQDCSQKAIAACFMALLEEGGDASLPTFWQRLRLNGVPESYVPLVEDLGLTLEVQSQRPSPFVSLEWLRSSGNDYFSTLSRNCRYQILRSMRKYGERGELSIARATTESQAVEWLDDLKTLHQKSWQQRGKAGAFANNFFERFCRSLIRAGLEDAKIDLLRVTVGQSPLGYLFNLIHDGKVMNYQSGIRYESDPHLKPGLISHAMAIDHYLRDGKAIYSFLAGDAQYKNSLAKKRENLYWMTLQKKSALLCIDAWARSIAQKLF